MHVKWQNALLGEVASIERESVQPNDIAPATIYVGLEHIEKGGAFLNPPRIQPGTLASSKFRFTHRQILYGKLRPYLAKIACPDFEGVCSTDILPIMPGERLDRRFLLHYLRQPSLVNYANSLAVGINLPRLSPSALETFSIPLPPIAEQRRIADILDRAESLRAKRRAALAQFDTLTQSIFIDMFGDPVTNPRRWDRQSLLEACRPYGGATPSTQVAAYWSGDTPWFSAKDIKRDDLFDAADHVSESVFKSTNLKLLPAGTVVIVVRGMILAHTFRVSVVRVPATINQDLRALLPRQTLDGQFLAACLRAQASLALQLVSAAAHGTKRLDSDGLSQLHVLLPPHSIQQSFARRVAAVEQLKSSHRESLAKLDELFASLQHRAFRREL